MNINILEQVDSLQRLEADTAQEQVPGPEEAAAAEVAAQVVKAAATESLMTSTMATSCATRAMELFGSFRLGDDEFALPASCIREVVNMPDRIAPIPLSPHYLAGVFTLRGAVIPVLSLARIFDAAAADGGPSQKLAIIDHQNIRVGILFDDTSEILRVRPEQRCLLQHRDPEVQNVIAGTIRLDDGARMVEILDPAALIRVENVPKVIPLEANAHTLKGTHFHLQAERWQCVSFRVSTAVFAFEMSAIQEIINVPELKSSVLHSELCIGRINLRGNAIPIVDFARVLGLADSGAAMAERRIIIARIGDAAVGLLVDSVDSILGYFSGDVLPVPLLSKTRAGMFQGCIHKDEMGEILLLDHASIFSQGELVELTQGHASLYRQEALDDGNAKSGKGDGAHRRVYITFSLGYLCAVEIQQIREIIECPGSMLKPPMLPSFIPGMLKLRRQMVSIVDLRALFRMPAAPDASRAKILVIEHGDECYGLMVDAVENIVTVADSDRIPTPQVLRDHAVRDLRAEMREVIDIGTADGGRQTFSVFDVSILMECLMKELGE